MPPKTNKPTAPEVAAIVPAEDKAAIDVLSDIAVGDPLTPGDSKALGDVLQADHDRAFTVAGAYTHAIKAGPAKGFHRAGRFWSREDTKVSRADYSDEEWATLEAEPMLTIASL